MRVIAGTLGGRRFKAPPGDGTRPTADRVREALFSSLGPLDGLRVLDLFAGSGALGIEALSRGAAHAVFVERDRRAQGVIAGNLAELGLGPDVAQLRRGDARTLADQAHRDGEAYDLVLIDPPYRSVPELTAALGPTLLALLTPGGRLVLESDRRAASHLGPAPTFERRYGDTLIRIYHP